MTEEEKDNSKPETNPYLVLGEKLEKNIQSRVHNDFELAAEAAIISQKYGEIMMAPEGDYEQEEIFEASIIYHACQQVIEHVIAVQEQLGGVKPAYAKAEINKALQVRNSLLTIV